VEHQKAEQCQGVAGDVPGTPRPAGPHEAQGRHGVPADAASEFLRDLRRLRDVAGLGEAELAARAHYPRDVIEAAETGPSLPDLPVLAAYVRGCGGFGTEVAEWEDRWRSATGTPASPLLSARSGGNSDAASAGARIGATSAAADSHDPSAIMAALDRFAEKMASASPFNSAVTEMVPAMRRPATAGTPTTAGTPITAGASPKASGTSDAPLPETPDQRTVPLTSMPGQAPNQWGARHATVSGSRNRARRVPRGGILAAVAGVLLCLLLLSLLLITH
jgi:hypothetical protein